MSDVMVFFGNTTSQLVLCTSFHGGNNLCFLILVVIDDH